MADRDPARSDEANGIATGELKGARAAALDGGNPDVPSVGELAESHHIAHAGSKAGEREDEGNIEGRGRRRRVA